MTASLRGADLLARSLRQAGVSRIFSLSGNHIMPVYDALIDTALPLLHVRHEGAAVHMADAWARLTGEVGVALVTGGPGHANAVSALYTAAMSESPVLLLSGHAPLSQAGWGAFQEMDQVAMAAPVTKAAWAVRDAASMAADVARACRLARSGRPGPVHLSLPTDVLEARTEAASLPAPQDFLAVPQGLGAAGAQALVQRLREAARPLVLVGPQGLTHAGRRAVAAAQDALGLPVVATESPRGSNDPALGAFAQLLGQADCVLLLGKRLDFTLKFGQPPVFDPACAFVQVDPDGTELARTRRAVGPRLETALCADALPALEALAQAAGAPLARHAGWLAEAAQALAYRPAQWRAAPVDATPVHPARLCEPIQALLDSHAESVLVVDGGEFGQWAQACLRAPHRLVNGPAGAIGAALPMAVAAQLARPGAPVVAMMGDGTFGFHCAEFDTALRADAPMICVVGNDARWNAEYQIQRNSYGADRLMGCELLPTRYDRVAAAFGGYGAHADTALELEQALHAARRSGLPACIDVALEGLPAPTVRR
ncbi:thiamine pyrophosphate-binding protein [Bordetella sp. 2513F-2]